MTQLENKRDRIVRGLQSLARERRHKDTKKLATEIVDWLSRQKHGDQNILHAAVCCDFVGRMNFIKAIQKIIEKNIVR